MLFDIPFLAVWNKIGELRQHQTNLNTGLKLAHVVIEIVKLVIKYYLEKVVSSANQKVGMNMILGLSHQFTQIEQSDIKAEQNQNDSSSQESHHTLFQKSN
jgi:hypothetical protein